MMSFCGIWNRDKLKLSAEQWYTYENIFHFPMSQQAMEHDAAQYFIISVISFIFQAVSERAAVLSRFVISP